jgi:lipopolysaccharide export system permease protein
LIEGKPAQTIRAERGELFFADDGVTLVMRLYDGEIHDVDEKDPKRYLRLKFSEHTLNIPTAGSELVRVDRDYRGDREMSIGTLMGEIRKYEEKLVVQETQVREIVKDAAGRVSAISAEDSSRRGEMADREHIASAVSSASDKLRTLKTQADSYRRRIRSLSVETHKKIAISFACAIFVFIGIPIGVRTREGSAGGGLVVSILFFAVYYAFLSAGEKLADRGYVSPPLSMWAANIVLGAIGMYLFVRANAELPFIPHSIRRLLGRKPK